MLLADSGRAGTAIAFITAIACASILTSAFFPGFMSTDSLVQFRQAIGQAPLEDSHPVIMAYLWRALLKIYRSPGVLLAFHQVLYWSAIALFVCTVGEGLALRLALLVLIGFCPPLVIQSLHLWKDVGMMGALALASAALLADVRKPHWAWLILSSCALFYATAVRVNGFIAVLPLLVFLSHRIVSRRGLLGGWRVASATAFLVAALSLAQYGAVEALNSQARHIYAVGTLTVWDMVAISLAENQDLLPKYLDRSTGQGDFMQRLAATFSADANYPSYEVISAYPRDEDQQRELARDWRSLVIQHPRPYLKHRSHVFATLLGIGRKEVYYPFHPGIDQNEFGWKFTSMTAEEVARCTQLFHRVAGWPVYRPWIYFLVELGVFLVSAIHFARRRRTSSEVIFAGTVALSGLATASSLFWIAPAADYRFVIWMILSSLFSAAILVFAMLRERWPAAAW